VHSSVPDITGDLKHLGFQRPATASWFGVSLTTAYRWMGGESPTPQAAWLAVTLARRLGGVPQDTLSAQEK
jgi:hypothetical protein